VEKGVDETRTLRRTMRDLVALSALPAVWAGYRPLQVAEGLAEVLVSTLRLDLVYLRLPGQTNGQEIEVARTTGGSSSADQTRGIVRALAPWLDGAEIDPAPAVLNPVGPGTVRVVVVPIGCGQRTGVLAAGSRQAAFPSEEDRLFLTLGANQMAAVLQRMHAEVALRESEERFRGTFENAAVGIAHKDAAGCFLRVNETYCQILGYTREELLQKTWQDITHPEDLAAELEPYARLMRGDLSTYALEKRYVRKDGSPVWIDLAVSVGRDAAEMPAYVIAIAQNISERKQLQEELRGAKESAEAAHSRVTRILESITDAFFALGHDWRFTYINPPAESLLRRSRDELLGKVLWDEFPEAVGSTFERMYQEARATGRSVTFEEYYPPLESWFEVRAYPSADGLSVYFRDMTERRRAEEALRRANDRLRLAVQSSNIGIWEVESPDGSFESRREYYINLLELLGYDTPQDQTDSTIWQHLVHPDDTERVDRTLRAFYSDKPREYVLELRMRHKDGSYRWFVSRGTAVCDEEGRLIRGVGSCIDITDLRRAEAAMRESERRFRTLAAALPHMVWTADPDGAHDYFNARNTEYTGFTFGQLRGWEWRATIHPDDLSRCLELWSRSVATGEPYEIEYRLRRFDGTYRWHLARALPLRDDAGRVTKWFGSCIDIDDQKRAEEAERRAREAAEAASRAKSDFLANVSHEIRTPMNAILGMTELAIDTPGSEEQKQFLTIVKSSADSLLNVINDLLDFSKIEAGKLALDPAGFSLRHVLGETLRALALRAHKKGLELACQIESDVPDALIGDAGRLRQILNNLVGNAIKFTEEGEVVVRIEAGPSDEAAGRDSPEGGSGPSQVLGFSVSDTGIGIPLDKQHKIFQAFEQEDSSTTRRYGGTGLGLAISARLVALMHGEIGVESAPGRGSTFRFTARFGLQPDQPGRPVVPPLVELQGLRVLVVDDNATNRRILEGWLRTWRTEPTAVAGGLEALDALWRASAAGRPFPLVVLDARMPGVDGPALAELIRQSPELAPTRIILLTSDDLHGEVARFRELGIAAWAMKPVQQEELLEIIYRVLSRPAPNEAATDRMARADREDEPPPIAAEPAASAARLRVLLAEDNDFNQQLVDHLLRRRGHDVVVAPDGRKALDALEHGPFDLLLLDIQMPELDGFQVIEDLRRRERTAGGHLPVVGLTAHAMKEDRERCLRAGMDDYLSKPIRSAELFAVIDRVLAGRPASEAPRAAAAEPGTVLDADTLLAACDDDPVLLEKLVRVFRDNAPGSLARVREAIARREPAQLRESAHRLRGLLATFSPGAAQAAALLEAMGAGGELSDAASALETLVDLIERLGPALEDLPIEELRRQSRRTRT
jgi:PAS domain S-box-containing protein